MTRRSLAALFVALVVAAPLGALPHSERPLLSPPRPGSVPDIARVLPNTIDVCKTKLDPDTFECPYQDIQAAVTAAGDNTLIRIWPGTYNEEPSRAAEDVGPDNPDGTYSYERQVAYPNAQNLIAILGKHNVTLRGMGDSSTDVVVDAAFEKHVGIRGDKADGLIIQNLSFFHAFEHGVYVLETDGFIIDRVVSGYSQEYPFLTFANDHGLMQYCEAFGGGDGGIYPGGSADTPGRYSNEISHCISHDNVLGYSGTQGDHNWVHDSDFYNNTMGLVSDSETDHPNYPQNNLILERNRFYDNNYNPYRADAPVAAKEFDEGAGNGSVIIPAGVGVFLPSGNDNLLQNNQFWGNSRYGVWLASGQGLVAGPTSEPSALPFASSGNRFLGNRMYPDGVHGSSDGNGVDFAWDGMGWGNCWEDNVGMPPSGEVSNDGVFLPPCHLPLNQMDLPATAGAPNPADAYAQASIVTIDGAPICYHTGIGMCVWSPEEPTAARNTPEGYRPPSYYGYSTTECGPSSC
jgi:hypothetical protein